MKVVRLRTNTNFVRILLLSVCCLLLFVKHVETKQNLQNSEKFGPNEVRGEDESAFL